MGVDDRIGAARDARVDRVADGEDLGAALAGGFDGGEGVGGLSGL